MEMGKIAGGLAAAPLAEPMNREQSSQNAVNSFQAKYGEKPKEARAVKKQLDKDDFMRIMITEMKHQDPTKPMDSDRMATQMAQVTSVEQLKNVSNAIEKLSDKNSASDRLAMSSMIGKTVTVDKSRFTHQKGTLAPINYKLPENSARLRITILNERGEEVAKRELEPTKAGENVYNWDGVNESSIQSPSGTYMVQIDAENEKGAKMRIDSVSKETVNGVTFEGGETNFLVGDNKSPQKVAFKSVIRIEGDQARAHAKETKAMPETAGSEVEASPSGLPPELLEKIKTEQLARAASAPASIAENEVQDAPGFPNGLQE